MLLRSSHKGLEKLFLGNLDCLPGGAGVEPGFLSRVNSPETALSSAALRGNRNAVAPFPPCDGAEQWHIPTKRFSFKPLTCNLLKDS